MQTEKHHQPAYGAAAVAGLAVMLLYVVTLAPTTAFWDTSEYISTAHIVGIPHPPGNPLFVLLARSWDVLLSWSGLGVAVRINLFSAAMSAGAHFFWFLMVERVLWRAGDANGASRRPRLIGAAAAVVMSATAFTVWNQSNVNEKVYTVSLFTIALLSWLIVRWRDQAGSPRSDNALLLIVFVLALSVGNHLMAFLAAPALLVFVAVVRPSVLRSWRLYACAVVVAFLGLSVHLFLPIRAGLGPVVNQADPRCASFGSAVVSVATLGRAGCGPLSDALGRKQYGKPSMFNDPVAAWNGLKIPRSPAMLASQTANFLQYFDWQWTRPVAGNVGWFGGVRPLITLLFLILGCHGARAHWRQDRATFAYFAVLLVTLSFGLMFYLNFRYGYTSPWRDATGTNTEVRERDYFFIVCFSLWGLWCGMGVRALWQRLAMRVGSELRAAPVLAVALVPLFANWTWASRAGDYTARDFAYNMLMSVEPYGILITGGDNDTFPLWYAQEVEGVRRDVTVIVMSYLNTGWYAKQLRDLTRPCVGGMDPAKDYTVITCQRPYVAPAGVTMYDASARLPSHSALPLTDAQIDTLASTAFISPATTFEAGHIASGIAAGTQITPADLFLAQIIKSSLDDRPIHFAMSSAGYGTLNLSGYLVRQGLAYRLTDGAAAADAGRGIIEVPVGGQPLPRFVDAPRTEQLATKVFVHHAGFPDGWNHWTDAASEQTPLYYATTYRFIAYAHALRGDNAGADHMIREALRYERLANVRIDAQARASR